jgi:hypothetical protein
MDEYNLVLMIMAFGSFCVLIGYSMGKGAGK